MTSNYEIVHGLKDSRTKSCQVGPLVAKKIASNTN
jgi:hypothetical protein